MTDQKILVCYNEPKSIYDNYLGKDSEDSNAIDLSENGFQNQINDLIENISSVYQNVKGFSVNGNINSLYKEIRSYKPDTILNLTESIEGNAQMESHIAAMFDILEVVYTGNGPLPLGNCLYKQRTKRILQGSGIPTPNYEVVLYIDRNSPIKMDLEFPLIVKLLNEDASIGISENSIVHGKKELRERVTYLFRNFKQDIIIEEFIDGRELNVSILGEEVLPISEISFKGLPKKLPKIITYEAKWAPESDYFKFTNPVCPAKLSQRTSKKIKEIALRAYRELECRDYARVDIRLAKHNKPYVIEINPNPDISPDAGFARAAEAADLSYDKLIQKIIDLSLERNY